MTYARHFMLFILLISSVSVTAQNVFQIPIGGNDIDIPSSIRLTNDGGFIVAGITSSYGSGISDAYLVKLDSLGNILWSKTYGAPAQGDGAFDVVQTNDGGFVIVGYYNKTNQIFSQYITSYIIRTDSMGDTLWTKVLGDNDLDQAYSVNLTSDNGFIISGHRRTDWTSSLDAYILKLDSLGNKKWSKKYGAWGGDVAYSIKQTFDGGYIFTGQKHVGNQNQVYLVKTRSGGDTLWTKVFGIANGTGQGYAVEQTSDSGYVLTGYTTNLSGWSNIYVIKTDSLGNLLWSRGYGLGTGYDILQTPDDGYVISGLNSDNAVLIKINSIGDTIWTRAYSHTSFNSFGGSSAISYHLLGAFTSLQMTADGGYIFVAPTRNYSWSPPDILVIKTDSLGYSGCQEYPTNISVYYPATMEINSQSFISVSGIYNFNEPTFLDSGGVVTMSCVEVGIVETMKDNLFKIYPNPSSGKFYIRFNDLHVNLGINVTNLMGQDVFSSLISIPYLQDISLPQLPDGIYFVKVYGEEFQQTQKLIIKQLYR